MAQDAGDRILDREREVTELPLEIQRVLVAPKVVEGALIAPTQRRAVDHHALREGLGGGRSVSTMQF